MLCGVILVHQTKVLNQMLLQVMQDTISNVHCVTVHSKENEHCIEIMGYIPYTVNVAVLLMLLRMLEAIHV